MCPIFRFAPSEEASPRAKANLMRAVVSGQLDPALLAKDELKQIADLCVNCHQCRLECPAAVDIPKLMIEAKAQYVASNGLGTADWVLTRLDSVARWSSRLATVSNWLLPLDAVAARKNHWHRSGTQVAAGRLVQLSAAGRKKALNATNSPYRRQSAVFRRSVCQLVRRRAG
jgi:L-lactate utilization protein LutB